MTKEQKLEKLNSIYNYIKADESDTTCVDWNDALDNLDMLIKEIKNEKV
jgi:hypothetical protein